MLPTARCPTCTWLGTEPCRFLTASSSTSHPIQSQASSGQSMESSLSSLAEQVFNIAELCEAILLHVKVADLLRCRRVSRTFYNTCSRSKLLRQKLFLEPDLESERTICPLIPAFFRHQKSGYRASTIAFRVDMVDLWKNAEAEVAPLWRDMYISQPPTTTCVIPIENHTLTMYPRRSYPGGGCMQLTDRLKCADILACDV